MCLFPPFPPLGLRVCALPEVRVCGLSLYGSACTVRAFTTMSQERSAQEVFILWPAERRRGTPSTTPAAILCSHPEIPFPYESPAQAPPQPCTPTHTSEDETLRLLNGPHTETGSTTAAVAPPFRKWPCHSSLKAVPLHPPLGLSRPHEVLQSP